MFLRDNSDEAAQVPIFGTEVVEVIEQVQYFQGLYQATMATNSTLDPQEVLRAIVQNAAEHLGAKGCSLMLLSQDRRHLHPSASYGLSERYMSKGPLDADLSLAPALRGEALCVFDAATDPRVQYQNQAREEGIASVLCVPVRLHDGVIGVLRVYTASHREFSPDDVQFAEAVAHLGAIALDNARRYTELKSHYDSARQDLLDWYGSWGTETAAGRAGGPATI